MSKNDTKKSKKQSDAVARKAALKALKDAPVIRDAWIAAIEAGAAAAIDVIRKASDAELVKMIVTEEASQEKKASKKAKESEKPDVALAPSAN